jgi:hypothetical protein
MTYPNEIKPKITWPGGVWFRETDPGYNWCKSYAI